MSPIGMTILLVVTLAAFAYSALRRWRLMMVAARPENRADQVATRFGKVMTYVFGQKRMPRYFAAGWAHIIVFFGFIVLLLNSIMLWVRGYVGHQDPAYDLWIFGLDNPLGIAYAFLRDIFTVLVIIGVLIFFWNRAIARLGRLTLNIEGLLILAIIFTMMVADLVYEGVEINQHHDGYVAAMPFGSIFAQFVGESAFLHHAGFWVHSALVLLFLNLLPYGKHFHVITVIPNVYAQRLKPPGRLPPTDDIEGKLEREETLGVKTVHDFSWKDVLDWYTCTECGRCSDQCPATNTGKVLSPKHFSIHLRDYMYENEKRLLAPANGNGEGETGETAEHNLLIPAPIKPEVLWACTTCGACEQECPVFITYIDKIVDMRRNLVMEQGDFPEQLQATFRGLETVGNPYSFANEQRGEWADGLDVPIMAENQDVEWLYWVGCSPSFDDRARKIARATARLLKQAGVSFAILGPEETCNGDPARRAGNEYLFQMMAQMNIETMNNYNVKKIITTCPHCYNTLKNEYPDFGGKYQVVHHTQFLADLVRAGKLKPAQPVSARVSYHDACYLGRHNNIYMPPRDLLDAIPGVQLFEPKQNKDRGMCCGAGGAQMWKEEEEGEARVNHVRTNQLLNVLPQNGHQRTIATSCPFCMTMLRDGLADQGHEDIETLDIAEILLRSVAGSDEPAKANDGAPA